MLPARGAATAFPSLAWHSAALISASVSPITRRCRKLGVPMAVEPALHSHGGAGLLRSLSRCGAPAEDLLRNTPVLRRNPNAFCQIWSRLLKYRRRENYREGDGKVEKSRELQGDPWCSAQGPQCCSPH